MAKDTMDPGVGGPPCPDSDHIAAERARLKQASVKHFAQSEKTPAAPPKQKQATGAAEGPVDLEDED